MVKLWIHLELLIPKSVNPFSSFILAESNESGEFDVVAQRNLLLSLVTLTIAVGWNIGKGLQNFVGDGGKKKGWFWFDQE